MFSAQLFPILQHCKLGQTLYCSFSFGYLYRPLVFVYLVIGYCCFRFRIKLLPKMKKVFIFHKHNIFNMRVFYGYKNLITGPLTFCTTKQNFFFYRDKTDLKVNMTFGLMCFLVFFQPELHEGTASPDATCAATHYGLASPKHGGVSAPSHHHIFWNIEERLQCMHRFIPAANQSVTIEVN